MKKRKRKKLRHPPLTALDKIIYLLGILIFIALVFLYLWGDTRIHDAIGFSKASVVAYSRHFSTFLAWPFMLYSALSLFIVLLCGWEMRKPIFGGKNIPYGRPPYREDCIPLINAKKYKVRVSPSQKRLTRKLVVAWLTVLIVLACLLPFSLFGRDELRGDYSIKRINFANQVTSTYTVEDFSHLTIRTERISSFRGIVRWTYSVEIKTKDGKHVTFKADDFDWQTPSGRDAHLDRMLEIKTLFAPEDITVKGEEKIDAAASNHNLNEQQREKLYRLFS